MLAGVTSQKRWIQNGLFVVHFETVFIPLETLSWKRKLFWDMGSLTVLLQHSLRRRSNTARYSNKIIFTPNGIHFHRVRARTTVQTQNHSCPLSSRVHYHSLEGEPQLHSRESELFTVVVIGTRRPPLKAPSQKVTTWNGYEFTAWCLRRCFMIV